MAETAKKRMKPEDYPVRDLRGEYKGIFTWAEVVNGKILDVSREILGEGTRMKEKLGTTITAVVAGVEVEQYAQELVEYGADRVIVVEHPDLAEFNTRAYASAVVQVIEKYKPEIFLYGATTTGRDLAPRIAARLEVGLSADCTEFNIGEFVSRPRQERYNNIAHFIRPSYGESKLATIIGPWTFPQMATARPGAMMPLERNPTRKGKVERMEVTIPASELEVKVIETQRATEGGDSSTQDLLTAQIVVAGGYGIGKDGFDMLEKLVELLKEKGHKAALGASRKAVEAGFVPSTIQVGQTGKTVRPQWYLAVGISGAIQHLAGMKFSRKVVAINTDANAPIFEHADYGLVGRYEDLIPELMKAVEGGYHFPVI